MKGRFFSCATVLAVLLSAQTDGIYSKRITPVDEAQIADFKREIRLAVIVGVGSYPARADLSPIKYAARDAQEISATLRGLGYSVATIIDAEATAPIIRQQLSFATAGNNPNLGSVLFFFAGHGFEASGRKYLACYDSLISGTERSGLALDEVAALLRQTGAPRQMLWIDAARNTDTSGAKSVELRTFSAFSGALGVRFLISAQPGQKSYEDEEWQSGVFAHYLIQGLKGQAAGRDGLITSGDLTQYVIAEGRNWSVLHKLPQTPYEDGEAALPFLLAGMPKAVQSPLQSLASTPSAQSAEMTAWATIEDRHDPVALEAFLKQFPDGLFTRLATQELAEIDYAAGKALQAGGSLADALARFDRVISLRPDNADALHLRARVHAALGKFDAAVQDLDRALKYRTDDADIYAERGDYLVKLNRPAPAIQSIHAALELRPGYPNLSRTICNATVMLGDFKRAVDECQKAVDADATDIASRYFLAESLTAIGQPQEAVTAFDDVLQGNPDAGLAYRGRGWSYYVLGRKPLAEKDMDEAVRRMPNDAQSFYNRALLRGDNNQIGLAKEDLDKVIALNPKATEALKKRAVYNAMLGNSQRAIEDANRAIEVDHGALSYAARGFGFLMAGNSDAALQDFSEALRLNPDAVEVYQSRATAYVNVGDLEHAMRDLEESLRRRPNDAKALAQRGAIYAREGDRKLAEADLTRAATLLPNAADVLQNSADAYEALGDLNHALEIRNKVVDISGRSSIALTMRALLMIKMGRSKDAIPDLDNALQMVPELGMTLAARALAFAQDGEYEKAAADADHALSITQDGLFGVMAWVVRSNIYETQGNYEEAIRVYTRGLEKNVDNPQLLAARAECWNNSGNRQNAVHDYSESLHIQPRNVQVREKRAAIYSQMDRLDLALADYDEILRMMPDYALGHANRAAVYGKLKKWDLALADANEALRLDPKLAGAWEIRAQLYQDMDRLDDAIADYTQEIGLNDAVGTHISRAAVYGRKRQFDLARQDLAEALRQNDRNLDVLRARAQIDELAGDLQVIELDYRRILEVDPNDNDAVNSLAYVLAERNTGIPEAYGLIKQALGAKPDNGNYQDTMAWVLYRMGEIDEAEKYERLAVSKTESFEIHDHLGDILQRKGRTAEALAEWQAALKILPTGQQQAGTAIQAKVTAAVVAK
jgi:tetratricopeptide (TPR) repeat protein